MLCELNSQCVTASYDTGPETACTLFGVEVDQINGAFGTSSVNSYYKPLHQGKLNISYDLLKIDYFIYNSKQVIYLIKYI